MMKLSFSTVGCPRWSFQEIIATAKDFGFQGIEIRGLGSELFAPRTRPFAPENLPATLGTLRAAKLEVPVLDSNCCLGSGDPAENEAEAKAYIDLARQAGTPCVRLMISPEPQPTPADLNRAAALLAALCEYAGPDITLLLETNGVFCDTALLAEFIGAQAVSNLGALWDIHHPYRYGGEAVEKTFANIGSLVRHVHVKDSVLRDGCVEYRMTGYGDVPIFDAVKLLDCGGYGGYLSLEWVKRWNPELKEPGIVFAHYANYVTHLLRQI